MAEYWHGKEPFVFMTVTDWPWEKPVKIQVPPAMLEAVAMAIDVARGGPESMRDISTAKTRDVTLEAALRWLDHELEEMDKVEPFDRDLQIDRVRTLWLAPEPEVPEVPEEIKDLLCDRSGRPQAIGSLEEAYNAIDNRILQAYKRGKESK